VQRLATSRQVLAAAGDDAYAKVSWALLRDPLVALSGDGATGWLALDTEERRPYFEVVGPPGAAAALLAAAWRELPVAAEGGPRVTLPRGTPALLPPYRLRVPDAVDWDFRWTEKPPVPVPAEARVAWLPASVAADGEIEELLAAASPTASAHPGDRHVLRWAGARDGRGRLAAVAADTSSSARAGLLASVAVRPDVRREGLGAAVVAWVTRALLDDPGRELVGLGMYATNDAGRALYDRLGFVDEHRFTSGTAVALPAGD